MSKGLIAKMMNLECRFFSIGYNGSGIAEGRDFKDKSFNLAQIPNRITNDCLTENALLLAIPC
jgi:hypothetical protein